MFFFRTTAILALAMVLVLSPVIPEFSNTVVVATMAASLGLLAWDLVRSSWRPDPIELMPVFALLLFAAALAPTTRSGANFFVLLALLPLGLALPLSRLFFRLGAHLTPLLVASLALAGSIIGTTIAAVALFVLGIERAELTMNAIHMGDLALTLGFIAASGVFAVTSRWRWIFLFGPLLAFMTIWWSGSRGPLLTFVGLAVLTGIFAVLLTAPRRHRWLFGLCLVTAVGALLVLAMTRYTAAIPGLNQVALLASGLRESVDYSTSIRLEMLLGALNAFLASPLYGHGGESFMAVAASFGSRPDLVATAPHLHSDLADFAAIGGTLGLIAYVALIVAPILAARTAALSRHVWLYNGCALSAGYFGMGLTNAMFGILTLTSTYAVVLAILLATRNRSPITPSTKLDAGNITD